MRIELVYYDPSLRNSKHEHIYRFYICSSFEIFFEKKFINNILRDFKYYVIGSFFVSELLEDFSQNSVGKDSLIILENLKTLQLRIENHKYFTKVDKARSLKMLNFLTTILI